MFTVVWLVWGWGSKAAWMAQASLLILAGGPGPAGLVAGLARPRTALWLGSVAAVMALLLWAWPPTSRARQMWRRPSRRRAAAAQGRWRPWAPALREALVADGRQ